MGRGQGIDGPIREVNPCKGCAERFIACGDRCPKDERGEYGRKAYKAEIERVNKNRRNYAKDQEIGWNNKTGKGRRHV